MIDLPLATLLAEYQYAEKPTYRDKLFARWLREHNVAVLKDDVIELRNEHAELYDALTKLARRHHGCGCKEHKRAKTLLQRIKMDTPQRAADNRVTLEDKGLTGADPYALDRK